MPSTLPVRAPATPRESLADICGKPVKASLDPQVPATNLRGDAAEAIKRTSGQKGAALTIGLNEGRLSHKNTDGSLTLAQLEALGPAFAVEFATRLLEAYGPLATPKSRAQQKVRELRAAADELDQLLEFIA